MKFLKGFLLVLICLVLFTPGASADSYASPDSTMYFHIEDPEALISNADDFITAMGMNHFLGLMPLREFLDNMLQNQGLGLELADFDLSKPIGIGAKFSDEMKNPKMYMVFGVRDEAVFKLLLPSFAGSIDQSTRFELRNGYAYVYHDDFANFNFRGNKNVKMYLLDSIDPGSISAYVDLMKIFKSMGVTRQKVVANMTEMYREMPSIDTSSIETVIDYIFDISSIETGLLVDRNVLLVDSLINIKKGKTADLLKKLSSAKGYDAYINMLPADALFSAAMRYDSQLLGTHPGNPLEMFKQIIELMDEEGDIDIDISLVEQFSNEYAKVMQKYGEDMAVSFDMDLSRPDLLFDENGKIDPEGLLKAIDIEFLAVSQLQNSRGFKNDYKRMLLLLEEMIDGMLLSRGVDFSVDYYDSVKSGGLVHDEVKFELEFTDDFEIDDPAEFEEIKRVVDALMDKLVVYFYADNKRVYHTMGKRGLVVLKSIVKTGRYPGKSITSSSGYNQMKAYMPDGSDSFIRVGLIKILNLAAGFSNEYIPEVNADGEFGIVFYADARDSALRSGLIVTTHELSAIFAAYASFLMGLM